MRALITGITGQDGSYLAEFLLSKGYEVHGIIRGSSLSNTKRIDHIFNKLNLHYFGKLNLHYGDITNASNITNLVYNIKPNEIYHLASMSHVGVSFEEPEYTNDVEVLGTLRLFEALRRSVVDCKIYNASSSEIFGNSPPPQNELTPLNPRSPYGVAKAASYWNSINYRNGYGMFISNGILFNHTSPRRGDMFVTKKIVNGIIAILKKSKEILMLGNLEPFRDFGFSPEYVELMWKILQLPKPDDFCIGTGISISIRDFLNRAFSYAGLPLRWEKTPSKFEGYVYGDKLAVVINKLYYRPTEVNFLQADNTKALKILNWKPKILVDDIIKIIVDYGFIKEGMCPIGEGINIIKNHDFSWSRIL